MTTAQTARGVVRSIVLCRHCNMLTSATMGCPPLRPGPCDGERVPAEPIRWAAPRQDALARHFFALRDR